MTIDTSAWKINDTTWIKQREEKWPIFEGWLIENYSSDKDRSIDGSLKSAKLFFQMGVLDKTIEDHGPSSVGFEAAIALHPKLNPDDVKKMIDFYCVHGRRGDLKGHFRQYYLSGFRYEALIQKGALPKDFMLQYLKGAYGNSLTEASQILEFEVDKVCLGLFRDLGKKLFSYFTKGDQGYQGDMARHMLPFYIEAMVRLTEEEARSCDPYFESIVRLKREKYDEGVVSDPDRLAFMKNWLDGMRAGLDKMAPHTRESLKVMFE
jgi:hypothetical protein